MTKVTIHRCGVWLGKVAIAARVAAELRKLPDIEVVIAPGGLGELRVDVGGKDVYQSNRFWYPRSSKVLKIIREQLAAGS
jgi:hypothetical protein